MRGARKYEKIGSEGASKLNPKNSGGFVDHHHPPLLLTNMATAARIIAGARALFPVLPVTLRSASYALRISSRLHYAARPGEFSTLAS